MVKYFTNRNLEYAAFLPNIIPHTLPLSSCQEEDEDDEEELIDGEFIYCPGAGFDVEPHYEEIEEFGPTQHFLRRKIN